jgi:hypothetical protein
MLTRLVFLFLAVPAVALAQSSADVFPKTTSDPSSAGASTNSSNFDLPPSVKRPAGTLPSGYTPVGSTGNSSVQADMTPAATPARVPIVALPRPKIRSLASPLASGTATAPTVLDPVSWPLVLPYLAVTPTMAEPFLDPRLPLPTPPGVEATKSVVASTGNHEVTPTILAQKAQSIFWVSYLQVFPQIRSVVRMGDTGGYVVWVMPPHQSASSQAGVYSTAPRDDLGGAPCRQQQVGTSVVFDLANLLHSGFVGGDSMSSSYGGASTGMIKPPEVEVLLVGIGEADVRVSILRIGDITFSPSEQCVWSLPWSWYGHMNAAALTDAENYRKTAIVSDGLPGARVPGQGPVTMVPPPPSTSQPPVVPAPDGSAGGSLLNPLPGRVQSGPGLNASPAQTHPVPQAGGGTPDDDLKN